MDAITRQKRFEVLAPGYKTDKHYLKHQEKYDRAKFKMPPKMTGYDSGTNLLSGQQKTPLLAPRFKPATFRLESSC